MKAATSAIMTGYTLAAISIHAAREGGDIKAGAQMVVYGVFQSTPPVKAATTRIRWMYIIAWISIHAAREGGDANQTTTANPK